MPRYRKTRRHLKSRKGRRTRRRQRGGAGPNPTLIERWVSNALTKFKQQGDNMVSTLGALKDDDLKLSQLIKDYPPDDPSEMKLTYEQKGIESSEDISEVAKLVHADLLQILNKESLNSVIPDEFRTALLNYPTVKETDDTVSFTLNFLLACENALREKAGMQPLEPKEAPIDALNGTTDILFIWALAINNVEDPDSPALIDPEAMKKNLSQQD